MTNKDGKGAEVQFQADLIDAVQQAVVAVDNANCVTAWNRYAETLFGWSRAEAMGKSYDELIAAGLIEGDPHSIPIKTDRSATSQLRIRRRDGTTFVASVTSSPIYGPDGAQRGRIDVSRDVTEQLVFEEQLRQAQKMEAVGRLAGGVAHDFNNLLTVVIAHAEFLRHGGPSSPQWTDDIDQITEAAHRASTLTRQLLAFGRKQVLLPRTIDLNIVVEGIASILQRSLGEDITLELNLDPSLPPIHADPGQLEQVVINLAANARDAMPRGGTVLIKTSVGIPAESSMVWHNGRRAADLRVALSVTDTGIGMDAATAANMFEPFFTTKDPLRGTGLGLSTVYGIVKQSGGTIGVDTAVGSGTAITVYLPVAQNTEVSVRTVAGPAAASDQTKVVLLVEDNPPVLRLAQRILVQHGYDVVEAASGSEALARLATLDRAISLLLTDIVMPDMNGLDLSIAVLRVQPDAAVLFMSGYTDDEVLQRGLLAPGTSFLPKPFTSDVLLAAVEAQLSAVSSANA
jgi:two-component system, cell cycle sensor histidine kinase and response regulator CckA